MYQTIQTNAVIDRFHRRQQGIIESQGMSLIFYYWKGTSNGFVIPFDYRHWIGCFDGDLLAVNMKEIVINMGGAGYEVFATNHVLWHLEGLG